MFVAAVFIFGLIVGSFLNSVIYRLEKGGNIVREHSRCPKCKVHLRWFELIPVFSFLIQKGKCRHCRKPISWQYLFVELTTGILFVATFLVHIRSSSYQLPVTSYLIIRDWVFVSFLIVVFVHDLRRKLILDRVTLPAMVVALGFVLVIGGPASLWSHAAAGLVAGGFFLLQFLVSRGRWIGGGDIRLGLLMGLMVGWPAVLAALFIAYVIGAIAALGLVATSKKQWSAEIPFGTFLSLGTFVALLYSQDLISWYLNLV